MTHAETVTGVQTIPVNRESLHKCEKCNVQNIGKQLKKKVEDDHDDNGKHL